MAGGSEATAASASESTAASVPPSLKGAFDVFKAVFDKALLSGDPDVSQVASEMSYLSQNAKAEEQRLHKVMLWREQVEKIQASDGSDALKAVVQAGKLTSARESYGEGIDSVSLSNHHGHSTRVEVRKLVE